MSGFTSPLMLPAPRPRFALKPPNLFRRLVWKLFHRCKHTLYAVDHRAGEPGRLCLRKSGHEGEHKSFDGRRW